MVNLKDGQQAAQPPPWHASAAYLWHADSALRARVRRLVQRGRSLVDGDYRELAGLDELASPPLGRNSPTPDRP